MLHLTNWMITAELPFFSKITIDNDFTLHNHNFFEIFYMTEGALEHTLNGNTSVIKQGDVFFLAPEDTHTFIRSENLNGTHRDIIISKKYFKELCDFLHPTLYDEYVSGKLPKHFVLSSAKLNEIETILQQISYLSEQDTLLTLMATRIVFVKLFENLLQLKITHSIESKYTNWFESLLKRFESEALVKQGLDAILEPYYFSKSYLCRIFKRNMKMTMTAYLNNKRLEFAAFLLKSTDQSVSYIINDVGFSSVPYFNKIFKEKYGCTPQEFRYN